MKYKRLIVSGIAIAFFEIGPFITPNIASADCTTTVIQWYCNKDANGDTACESKAGSNMISRCKADQKN